ncbi:MAG TPA: hypothetical protein VMU84_07545 [Thermoanaerobaculia bacterium]|nr:hypothetical protein [Thermoanaerobaculia bacterium]
MKRSFAILLAVALVLPIATESQAARVRVVKRNGHVTRVRVTTRPGFPIRRTLPTVVVRPVTFRVAPRVYLGAVAFTAVAIATLPPRETLVWASSESLDREDGWTDFSLNVDQRGRQLLLEIDHGAAQISFAEVVFENGDAQIVDFNDSIHRNGIYSLLDFKDGRKVDHVRIVAKADRDSTDIRLHLVV